MRPIGAPQANWVLEPPRGIPGHRYGIPGGVLEAQIPMGSTPWDPMDPPLESQWDKDL